MNLFNSYFKRLTPIVCAGVFFCACDDKDAQIYIDTPNLLGRYEIKLRASQEELILALTGIEKEISYVESGISWLDVTPGELQDNTPTVRIKRLEDIPQNFTCDSLQIYFKENECATLIISKEGLLLPSSDNSGEYEAFNSRWWEQGDILYNSSTIIGNQQISERILLPWASMTTSNIPSELFYDPMTSAEGWQMAYNLFACEIDGQHHSKPYFILYNKYSGIMRVFYYQRENPGPGGEFSFIVSPHDKNTQKFPFYHSLQYGIPLVNGQVQGRAVVDLKNSSSNTFEQYITPYRKSDGMLKQGWYCFDIDLSAYQPDLTTPFGTRDLLSLDCITTSNSSISLLGSLDGGLDGNFEAETSYSTTTSNGLNYLDQFSSGISNITECIKGFASGNYLQAAFRGGLSIYNFSKSLLGYATDDYATTGKTSGTISMNLGAVMSLEGYIFSNTSNNAEGTDLSYNALGQSQQIGKGVWSLQENPVIYVVNDRLLGEDEDFACFIDKDGYDYGVSDPSGNNLRLMTFFDPQSIKVNLNHTLYKDIRNARISWVYGVYPNQENGHTNPFRLDLLKMNPAKPQIADHEKYLNERYTSWGEFGMKYIEYPLETMKPSSLVSSTEAKVYKQKGSNYRYYGHAGNNETETSATFFVTDPIVMLPTTYEKKEGEEGAGYIYDFESPDFFVAVIVDFEYTQEDGKMARAFFTKRFIPEVKAISTADMKKKRDELINYVNNGVHQTIGGIQFKSVNANELLSQFFSTSEYILKQE